MKIDGWKTWNYRHKKFNPYLYIHHKHHPNNHPNHYLTQTPIFQTQPNEKEKPNTKNTNENSTKFPRKRTMATIGSATSETWEGGAGEGRSGALGRRRHGRAEASRAARRGGGAEARRGRRRERALRPRAVMPEQSNDYRVVVFGAGGVGKSSLVLRFVKGTFREAYIPTIEDTYRQVVRGSFRSIKIKFVFENQSHKAVCVFTSASCRSGWKFSGYVLSRWWRIHFFRWGVHLFLFSMRTFSKHMSLFRIESVPFFDVRRVNEKFCEFFFHFFFYVRPSNRQTIILLIFFESKQYAFINIRTF